MPYITYYSSISDLVHKLGTLTPSALAQISELMKAYNMGAKKDLLDTWTAILKNIAQHSVNHPH
jgi:phage tail tape-measure protein